MRLPPQLDVKIVRVWRGKFSLFTVLCTLVSYLCVSLNIAPLTERSRNRTAGRNQYMGVHRERLETLNSHNNLGASDE